MPALSSRRNTRPTHVKRRKPDAAQIVAKALRTGGGIPGVGSVVRAPTRRPPTRRQVTRRASRAGATIPVVGAAIGLPARAPALARERKIQRQLDRAVRSAGKTGSPYPIGAASDIYLAPAMQKLLRQQRRAQQRGGWGPAADYYQRHPQAARSTVIRARDLSTSDQSKNLYATDPYQIITPEGAAARMRYGAAAPDIQALAKTIQEGGLIAGRHSIAERKARNMAPMLKVLEQLQRGQYLAGGAIHGIKSGNPLEALERAYKGAMLQEKHTPGKEIVGKGGGVVGGLARFALDVGLDPTTYITLGTTSVVGKTAANVAIRVEAQAARAAYKNALAQGVSRATARKLARDAGRREGRKAFDRQMTAAAGRRGITVGVTGGRTARKLAHRAAPGASARLARRRGGRTARERIAQERPAAAPLTRFTAGLGEAGAGSARALVGLGKAERGAQRLETLGAATRRVMGWHGGVRSPDVARAENADLKAIRREGRSAEEHGVRMSIARANLGRKLTDDEDALIINAIERNKIGRLKLTEERAQARAITDPGKRAKALKKVEQREADLRSVAKHYRDDFRYRFRRESRQGTTAARAGQKSREEIRWEPGIQRHGQTRKQLVKRYQQHGEEISRAERRIKELDDKRAELERERVMAMEDPLNESSYIKSHVPERAARKKRALQIGDEIRAHEKVIAQATRQRSKLRGAIRKEQHQLGRAKSRHAAAMAERKRKAAYFARVPEENVKATKTLIQQLAEPLRPKREHITPSKPKPVSSRYRKHTGTREELRAGDETEQAAIARASTKSGVSVAYRGISGARGERAGFVNRQVAQRFGEPVPKDFSVDTMNALRAENKSVYKLERGELVKVEDVGEIKRGAKQAGLGGALKEGEERAARYRYLRDEGMTPPQIREAMKREPTRGRYVVLRDPIVAEARKGEKTWDTEAAGQLYDVAMRGFKSLALATPQYLARNFAGDMFNAWTEENAFRLMRNSGRAQRALHQLGRYERGIAKGAKGEKKLDEVGKLKAAGRRFAGLLPNNKRWIKLTPAQAREIAGPSGDRLYNLLRRADPNVSKDEIRAQIERNLTKGRVPAVHVAMLAEQMGVVRQGRFLELMQEGRREFGTGKGRAGITTWQSAVKRVEDSTRLATFMGGLQRGLSPREAASRATRLHFDYGDLSTIERNFLRRAMPFYTFPSRNIPLQAQQVLRRPGKYATVEKAREEAARTAGLDEEDYQKNLSAFEARQIPLPIRYGTDENGKPKIVTLSMAQPFTDLNDVTSFAEGFTGGDKGKDVFNVGRIPAKRVMESLGPWKTFAELPLNKSFYFREDIAPEGARLTRAPVWAKALKDIPGFREATGYQTYQGKGGKTGPAMWDKRAEFALRSILPGAAGAGAELAQRATGTGAKKNWRGRTENQKLLNLLTGVRATTYNKPLAKERGDYERYAQLKAYTEDHRQLAKEAGITDPEKWKTKKYQRALDEMNAIEKRREGRAPGGGDEELTGAAKLRAERSITRRRSDTSGAAALRAARAAGR